MPAVAYLSSAMKIVACIFIVLSGLFTVQPLVMMAAQEKDKCESASACSKVCGESKAEQKAENKNCDTTTRCNTSS
ncbi:MAG TPA: hypothetical protein DHW64_00410 [Chitinophagaceae bacterium]|nr:hypothetical protein [Chitinophagaceae bacterium]